MLCRLHHGECSEELRKIISAAEFRRSVIIVLAGGWRFTAACLMRSFLPDTLTIWNNISSVLLPINYKKKIFEKKAYYFLKGRQRTRDCPEVGRAQSSACGVGAHLPTRGLRVNYCINQYGCRALRPPLFSPAGDPMSVYAAPTRSGRAAKAPHGAG
ncbi:hypothetical protein EVAR_761_1 [Eumeta japonica]|uniref:Uncharacterized protein n=1 Tax=Eumeta variegata TaxID=151549 RepID=A0A4C1SE42_EUMVA|nr:hypothetical protein EVAR_761_1 [Eumeta japonica]